MNIKQMCLVKGTWNLVEQLDSEIVASHFYSRLLEGAPELKPFFPNPVPEQSSKLFAMISYVVERLNKLEHIIHKVKELARCHIPYGAQQRHYANAGAALLWTLEKGLSDMWDQEVKEAWIACYTLVSVEMTKANVNELFYDQHND